MGKPEIETNKKRNVIEPVVDKEKYTVKGI